jgi:acyl-CoA synthetase (NDP forming)
LVNPSCNEVQGVKVYPTVKDIPGTIDLAIVITSAHIVPAIVKDCVEKNIKGVIIVSDGFTERGGEGVKLQKEINEIVKCTGIRILGPNTLGTTNTTTGLVTTPFTGFTKVKKGNIAFAAQTGMIGPQALPYKDWGCRISKICDFGNKCDVDESDLLEYLADDPQTNVIAMHLEGIKDGRRFLNLAKEVVPKKPILIFKPGRTEEAAKALMSHTGSLAGEQEVYESAFKQTGIIQINSFKELFEISKAFSYQPLPGGNRLGVVTVSGGMGIIAIDSAIDSGLVIPKLSTETNEKLFKIHPTLAGNPSDIDPAAVAMAFWPFKEVIEAILNDENVDGIVSTFWSNLPAEYYVNALGEIRKPENKPMTFFVYGPSLNNTDQLCIELENNGYPAYQDIETAVKALGAMYQYSSNSTLSANLRSLDKMKEVVL